MTTFVYVDAFNLYYGAVKGTPFKWLDLSLLCGILLPRNRVECIKYFTARVDSHPRDPDQPLRQQTYLRALRTILNLEIYYGHFLTHPVKMPLAYPVPGGPERVEVIKREEKGSDVNLATHLLCDGFRNRYEVAVVISGDSDLLMPIETVIHELGKPVGVISPHPNPSRVLLKAASFYRTIRRSALARCQFPDTLEDSQGTFRKPERWST